LNRFDPVIGFDFVLHWMQEETDDDDDKMIISDGPVSSMLLPVQCIPEMNATILFNSLYDIVGPEFSGKYTSVKNIMRLRRHGVMAGYKGTMIFLTMTKLWRMAHHRKVPVPVNDWVKIVTIVTTLHLWNKKPLTESNFGMADIFDDLQMEPEREMCPPPLTESSTGMTSIFGNSCLQLETGLSWD
ncbi:hypothetical protein EJB05_21197, partial [Eragrostis curvula]